MIGVFTFFDSALLGLGNVCNFDTMYTQWRVLTIPDFIYTGDHLDNWASKDSGVLHKTSKIERKFMFRAGCLTHLDEKIVCGVYCRKYRHSCLVRWLLCSNRSVLEINSLYWAIVISSIHCSSEYKIVIVPSNWVTNTYQAVDRIAGVRVLPVWILG